MFRQLDQEPNNFAIGSIYNINEYLSFYNMDLSS